MLARVMVLETYLSLLQLQMVDATGISVSTKEQLVTRLDAMLAELATHRQQVEAASDRPTVTALTTDFEALAPQIEDIAYESQTYLAIGKLQTVYDKAQSLSEEIHQVATSASDLKQAERDRGYAEIQDALQTVNANIDEIEAELANSDRTFSRSYFSGVVRELGTIYTGLSQTLSYLSELLRL